MAHTKAAWVCLAAAISGASCGNVVIEAATEGGGGDGGSGAATSTATATGGAAQGGAAAGGSGGLTGTMGQGGSGGTTFTSVGGGGLGPCPADIEAAVAAAPANLGFQGDPPPSGTYVVEIAQPDLLLLASAEGKQYGFAWAGEDLTYEFAQGDTVFVQVDGSATPYEVIAHPAQHYVAVYQTWLSMPPEITAEPPYGQPIPGFGAACQLAGSECKIAWDLHVPDGEFAIVPVSVGESASAGSYEFHSSFVVSACDGASSQVRFTVRGPTEGPE